MPSPEGLQGREELDLNLRETEVSPRAESVLTQEDIDQALERARERRKQRRAVFSVEEIYGITEVPPELLED